MSKPQAIWTIEGSPFGRAMERWQGGVPQFFRVPRERYSPKRWERKVREYRRIWRRLGGDTDPLRRNGEDWARQTVAGAGFSDLTRLTKYQPTLLRLPRSVAQIVRHHGKRRRHGRGIALRPAMLRLCRAALAVARLYPPEAYYGRRTGPNPWDVWADLPRLVVSETVCREIRWGAEGLTEAEKDGLRCEHAEAERARADAEIARQDADARLRASAERIAAGLRAEGYTDEQIAAAARAAKEAA